MHPVLALVFHFCLVFFLRLRRPPGYTLFPYTTLFRSSRMFERLSRGIPSCKSRVGVPIDSKTRASAAAARCGASRSEEHTSELQSPCNLVCRLLLEKKNNRNSDAIPRIVPVKNRQT